MGEMTGCNLLNTKRDERMPSEFTSEYHVHILVRGGEMQFSDGKQMHVSQKDDLVIWQRSNAIQEVVYSDDFEADFLIASGEFLSRFNPEMVWASKGFIFIRINPSFHLHEESLRLMNNDFALFRQRLDMPESPLTSGRATSHSEESMQTSLSSRSIGAFKEEIIGRVMQIFLYDLWTVYSSEMSQMETNDRSAFGRSLPAGRENAARIFLRFLALVQKDCRQQRDVAYYADKLCITAKYLSQVSRSVSGLPASEWITYYATFELVSLLNDQSKTLTEVADLMNFETASHFSRYVKKLLGKSPSEYRNRN